MKQHRHFVTADELEGRLKSLRSLSGCFRLVRLLEQNDINAAESNKKIDLLTQLLDRMEQLSGIDPREPVTPNFLDRESKPLLRSYGSILVVRAGQRIITGNNLSEAEADVRQALRIAQVLADGSLEALALNKLGNVLLQTQRTEEGQEYLQLSVDISRKNNQFGDLVRSLYNLAGSYMAAGEISRALMVVNHGLNIYEQQPTLPVFGQAFFLNVRQQIYSAQGQHGKALADGLRSLALFKQEKMSDWLVPSHSNLVYSYLSLQQPAEALHHAMQGAELALQTNSVIDQGISAIALATVHIHLDDLETAMQYARQAWKEAQVTGLKRMEVPALERIANIVRCQGKYRLALPYLYEALEIEDRIREKAALHLTIASIWVDLKEPEEARKEIQEREKIYAALNDNRPDGKFLLVSAAIAAEEQKPEEAIEILNSLISQENISITFRKDAHKTLSDLYKQIGNLSKALEHYQQFHALALEREHQLVEERLIVLRTQHEVERYQDKARRAQAQQQKTLQEKELLALEASERQTIIEHTRLEIHNALRNLEQSKTREGKKSLQEVLRTLHTIPAAEKQWLHHLPNIDNDFFARLREQYPSLTKGQIRLCGLLRSGFASSDIAQRLHISIETVTTQRKRLRKRMSLKKGENLEKLLAQV